jgi:hypothetical protein
MHLFNTSSLISPTQSAYTFRSKSGQSFIDHILVESINRDVVSDFKILPYAASDHKLVLIIIDLKTPQIRINKKKTAYWKLNVSLLDDPDLKIFLPNFLIAAEEENFYITASLIGGSKILNVFLNKCVVNFQKKREPTSKTEYILRKNASRTWPKN